MTKKQKEWAESAGIQSVKPVPVKCDDPTTVHDDINLVQQHMLEQWSGIKEITGLLNDIPDSMRTLCLLCRPHNVPKISGLADMRVLTFCTGDQEADCVPDPWEDQHLAHLLCELDAGVNANPGSVYTPTVYANAILQSAVVAWGAVLNGLDTVPQEYYPVADTLRDWLADAPTLPEYEDPRNVSEVLDSVRGAIGELTQLVVDMYTRIFAREMQALSKSQEEPQVNTDGMLNKIPGITPALHDLCAVLQEFYDALCSLATVIPQSE